MSYSRLGQAPKIVPGLTSLTSLPPGRTAPFNYEELVKAGLPLAPYMEYGSYARGEPAIMRYGLDPYRGIMGLGQVLTETFCENTELARLWRQRMSEALNATMLVSIGVGALAGAAGGLLGRPALSALAGGIIGWMAHATQTAVYEP